MYGVLNTIFAAVIISIIVGCANTQITAYKDPKYDEKEYESFVVFANADSLRDRQYLEAKLCEEIKFLTFGTRDLTVKVEGLKITCMPGWTIFPPTRTFSIDAKRNLLTSLDVGALLIVSRKSSAIRLKTVYNVKELDKSYTHVDSSIDKYEIVLIDVKEGEKVLVGTSETTGDKAINKGVSTIFLDSLANAVVEQLSEKRLLKQNRISIN